MGVKSKYIILFNLLLSSLLNAQVKDSNIISSTPTKFISGLTIGYSNIYQTINLNGQNFSSKNLALNLGLLFEYELINKIKFSMRPGLLLFDDVKTNFVVSNKLYFYKYQPLIVEMPLLLTYKIAPEKKFNGIPNELYFGPVINYNIANKSVNYNGSNTYSPTFTRDNETSLKLGIGYDFKLKFVNFRPDFGYNFGFNSLLRNNIPYGNLTKLVNNQFAFRLILSSRKNKVVFKKVERKEPTQPPIWKKLFGSKY